MLDYITQHSNLFFNCLIISSTLSFILYYLINKSSENELRFLNVKALKSSTNAKLLGGLPLAISTLTLILISSILNLVSKQEQFYLNAMVIPILIITLYGFLDDKHEIRARHKLLLQILAISLTLVPLKLPFHQFFIAFVFGLAFINGANLIDGLDTLFAKVAIVLSTIFLCISLINQITSLAIISITILATISIFLKFNKEPAKIYAGEIGASLFGYLLFTQSIIYIYSLKNYKNDYTTKELFFICVVTSLYPLMELGVTFIRRLYFKRSPFLGDHLHLHHILKNNFKLSPSTVANCIAGLVVFTSFLTLTVYKLTNLTFSLICGVSFISYLYIKFCYSTWKRFHSEDLLSDLFLKLDSENVIILDGKNIDDAFENNFKETN